MPSEKETDPVQILTSVIDTILFGKDHELSNSEYANNDQYSVDDGSQQDSED